MYPGSNPGPGTIEISRLSRDIFVLSVLLWYNAHITAKRVFMPQNFLKPTDKNFMNKEKILGTSSFVLGLLLVCGLLGIWAIILQNNWYGLTFASRQKVAQTISLKKELGCTAKGGKFVSNSCFTIHEPRSIEEVCKEWNDRMQGHKDKVYKSLNYLNSIITEEQRQFFALWSVLYGDDYDKHIIPTWIDEQELMVDDEEYIGFNLRFSAKIGDWYKHELGGWIGNTPSNWVVIKKSERKKLLTTLINTADKRGLVEKTNGLDEIWKFKQISDYQFNIEKASKIYLLKGFSGFISANIFPLPTNSIPCEQVISKLRECDPHIRPQDGLGMEFVQFGTDNSGMVFIGASNYKEGRLSDCHTARFNVTTNQLSCESNDCDPTPKGVFDFGISYAASEGFAAPPDSEEVFGNLSKLTLMLVILPFIGMFLAIRRARRLANISDYSTRRQVFNFFGKLILVASVLAVLIWLLSLLINPYLPIVRPSYNFSNWPLVLLFQIVANTVELSVGAGIGYLFLVRKDQRLIRPALSLVLFAPAFLIFVYICLLFAFPSFRHKVPKD